MEHHPWSGRILCPVLVGREDARRRLAAAVDAAAKRRGGVCFVVGEAGVGKSRLAEEARSLARRAGLTIVAGRAVEAGSPVPFRPLSEGLLSAFRSAGVPRTPEFRSLGGALGRLVPEWRPDAATTTDSSLVDVSEALVRLLRVLAGGRGCLVVLEDLHWSDPETLAVVEYLADNLAGEPVLCLGTLRGDEVTPALTLARGLGARRAALVEEPARLDEPDTQRMAAACLGVSSVPSELAASVHTWSDGVPFLIEELLAAWIGCGALEHRSEGWELRSALGPMVPSTFADTVRRRLTAVGAEGRTVMAAAAVLGRRFDWALVPAITGLERATVLAVLRRCMAAQLVVDDGGDDGEGFRLRHALTREAVLGELLSPERAELSGRASRAVEELHPALDGHWCDLAAELARAAGDVERTARLLLITGRRALVRGALTSAEAILVRARELGAADVLVRTALDEALVEVFSQAGKCAEAVAVGDRVLVSLAQQAAPPVRCAEVHLHLARALLNSGAWASTTARLHQARRYLEPGAGPSMGARIDALAAHVALGEARLDDAARLATSALTVAERAALPEVACEALEVIGRRARLLHLVEAEAAFDRARVIAERHGLVVWRVRALQELAASDVATSRRLDRLTSARDAAWEAGALTTVSVLDLHIATVLAFRFEADEGLVVARRCAAAARRLDLGGLLLPMARVRQATLPMALVRQAQCHAVRGDAASMETCIADALAAAPGDRDVSAGVWGQCRATLSLLRENRARGLRELVTAAEFVRGHDDALLWVFRGLLAVVATVVDREGTAARAELAASGLTALPHHRAFLGYAEAVELGRRGYKVEADDSFVAARAEMALAGGGYGAGYLALRLVAEAALTDGWGEPVAWLREAERFFEGTGQARVAAACRSLLGRAGAPVPRRRRERIGVPAPLATLGITAREHEVLVLVAERLSNKGIAARLYISPRTVDKHVERLLAKTQLHDRAQLSDLAARLDGS
jgi:DNA-binding CsgD family transcriptional regulator